MCTWIPRFVHSSIIVFYAGIFFISINVRSLIDTILFCQRMIYLTYIPRCWVINGTVANSFGQSLIITIANPALQQKSLSCKPKSLFNKKRVPSLDNLSKPLRRRWKQTFYHIIGGIWGVTIPLIFITISFIFPLRYFLTIRLGSIFYRKNMPSSMRTEHFLSIK